jgi:hypothetical protein
VGELPVRMRDRARVARGELVFRKIEGALFLESPRPTDALFGQIVVGRAQQDLPSCEHDRRRDARKSLGNRAMLDKVVNDPG